MTYRILNIAEGTSVDGPGLRTSLYFAGCDHQCPGCHNPESWAADGGREMDEEEILRQIDYNDFPVTFSGGDPLFRPEEIAHLARRIKEEQHRNIWCFTGYRWEAIADSPRFRPLLEQIDVLVDSPFVLSLRDTQLRFRGSSNQRIIDVPASLRLGKMVDITERY